MVKKIIGKDNHVYTKLQALWEHAICGKKSHNFRDKLTSIFSLFYSCIHRGDVLWARGLAPSVRPLFPPTSPLSNGPGRAPEATDRLDIVAGDY